MAGAVVVVALALAGCGSSQTTSSAKVPAAGSTGRTPSATTPAVKASDPIGSPQVRALLTIEGEKSGLPAGKAAPFINCLVTKFAAAGIKTAGDISVHTARATTVIQTCNQQLGLHVKA